MNKHDFDPRTQLHTIVWHGDPTLERLIVDVVERGRPDAFVETGSHMGWTSAWVAERWPKLAVRTVEVDGDYYGKARDNLAPFSNAEIAHGHSVRFLSDLELALSLGTPLFWLDAHWWPPVPLRDECKIVSRLERYICIIDDFQCYRPDFSGDTFFSVAPSHGDAYLNDISYVSSVLGERYWRPTWDPLPGSKGVGLFVKGVDYEPPPDIMRAENLESFVASRPADAPYLLHPSCRRLG